MIREVKLALACLFTFFVVCRPESAASTNPFDLFSDDRTERQIYSKDNWQLYDTNVISFYANEAVIVMGYACVARVKRHQNSFEIALIPPGDITVVFLHLENKKFPEHKEDLRLHSGKATLIFRGAIFFERIAHQTSLKGNGGISMFNVLSMLGSDTIEFYDEAGNLLAKFGFSGFPEVFRRLKSCADPSRNPNFEGGLFQWRDWN